MSIDGVDGSHTHDARGDALDGAAPALGWVLVSKVVGDDAMVDGPLDDARYDALPIDGDVWRALAESGLAEDMSALATGVIDRHEDGAIEGRQVRRLIRLLEESVAYVDDPLAEFLATLRYMARDAVDRGVPVLFTLE